MQCRYPDQDLIQRLDRGIARYRGHPYYVIVDRERAEKDPEGKRIILKKREAFLYHLDNVNGDHALKVSVDDPDFDISTPPLGYYQQTKDSVTHVVRRPLRRFKQTLDPDSVFFHPLSKENQNRHNPTLFCAGFKNAIIGNFLSYQDIQKEFAKSVKSIERVLSIDVALKWIPELKITHVFFKNELVGWISPNEPTTVIVPNSEKGWVVSKYLQVFNGWKVE